MRQSFCVCSLAPRIFCTCARFYAIAQIFHVFTAYRNIFSLLNVIFLTFFWFFHGYNSFTSYWSFSGHFLLFGILFCPCTHIPRIICESATCFCACAASPRVFCILYICFSSCSTCFMPSSSIFIWFHVFSSFLHIYGVVLRYSLTDQPFFRHWIVIFCVSPIFCPFFHIFINFFRACARSFNGFAHFAGGWINEINNRTSLILSVKWKCGITPSHYSQHLCLSYMCLLPYPHHLPIEILSIFCGHVNKWNYQPTTPNIFSPVKLWNDTLLLQAATFPITHVSPDPSPMKDLKVLHGTWINEITNKLRLIF